MKHTCIRTKEIDDKEVYIDVNDLMVELLRDLEKCATEAEKKVYQDIVNKLVELRKKAHDRATRDSESRR